MLTVNGRVRLCRVRWHDREEGSETPIDRLLDAAERTISEGVREMACRVNQDASSFAKAAENLSRTAHLELSKETFSQLVEEEAKAVLAAMRGGQIGPEWMATDCVVEEETTRVYLGCDGVKVPLVTDEEKKKRRRNVHQKRRRRGRRCKPLPRPKAGADNAYKEFKIGCLYDEQKQQRYVGVTARNHEAAGRMLRRMGDQVQLDQADQCIALVDGAPWIRNQIEFHGLTQQIGLDFYHLRDNAQTTRRAVFGESSEEGQYWLNQLMHTFKHDGYRAAWEQLVDWHRPLRGARREAANRLLRYVAERHDMIRYPEFLQRGWQIGSGPTEAECKTTTQRVKGRGRRWDSPHAEAMMALAALHDSGLWKQRWTTLDPQRN